MSQTQIAAAQAAELRQLADAASPAGPLFISGEYAETEIIGNFPNITVKCGTACTGSATRQCC